MDVKKSTKNCKNYFIYKILRQYWLIKIIFGENFKLLNSVKLNCLINHQIQKKTK